MPKKVTSWGPWVEASALGRPGRSGSLLRGQSASPPPSAPTLLPLHKPSLPFHLCSLSNKQITFFFKKSYLLLSVNVRICFLQGQTFIFSLWGLLCDRPRATGDPAGPGRKVRGLLELRGEGEKGSEGHGLSSPGPDSRNPRSSDLLGI